MIKQIITTLACWGLMINAAVSQTIDTLVDVGGYRLYFHIIQGKGTPILFEGGAGADLTVWDTLLAPVAEVTRTTLITYDRPGFGKSELDTSNHDLDKHGILEGSKALETGLKKLGYDGALMLIAHSYGGFCATLYAARHPSAVKAAVLIDANHVSWFQNSYVDSVMKLRKQYWESHPPTNNWADYYAGMNLARTVEIMRKSPFPETIPVIDLVSQTNFPDSAMAARWKISHAQFAAAAPNRMAITAYGCGHFIFRDNLLLAIAAIVKAYTGVLQPQQALVVLRRFVAYSLHSANELKRNDQLK